MGEKERPRKNKPGISGVPDELDERLTYIKEQIELLRPKNLSFFSTLLQGVTILAIISFAFWLGQLSSKISETSTKVDRLYGLTVESRDSLSARLSAVQAKIDAIDKKLDSALSQPRNRASNETASAGR